MVFEIIKKEFKHSNCDELNRELDTLISDLSFNYEGLTDNFMDIVLDHSNQKEKEWTELYDAPTEWLESILIKTQKDILEEIIDKLEDILYTKKPKRQSNMNAHDSREWLIDNVRPLILDGMTSQTKIAEKIGIDARNGLMTRRVRRAYNCKWKEYVDNVQNRRY